MERPLKAAQSQLQATDVCSCLMLLQVIHLCVCSCISCHTGVCIFVCFSARSSFMDCRVLDFAHVCARVNFVFLFADLYVCVSVCLC